MDASWSRWHRTSADQQVLARLMWSLYTLNADQLYPDHALFVEFQVWLRPQLRGPSGCGRAGASGAGAGA